MKPRVQGDLAVRIERLALDPDAIAEHTLFRIARPLFALTGWRARLRHAELVALVAVVKGLDSAAAVTQKDRDAAAKALSAAVAELESNVATLERVAIVRGRPPVAHAAWARRVWEVLVSAAAGLEAISARGSEERAPLRRVAGVDRAAIAPPLALAGSSKAPEDAAAFLAEVTATKDRRVPESEARVVELELATIDHLLAAARAETDLLGRRRRLLVAARQRLLDASAALPLDEAGTATRLDHIAREIARVDRLESLGLEADVGLAHQAQRAIDRGDPRSLWAALAAIDAASLASGDLDVARVTTRSAPALWGDVDPSSAEARRRSLTASASELLGAETKESVAQALRAGREAARRQASDGKTATERRYGEILLDRSFGDGAEDELLASVVAVDGCFEVGGALSPVRIVEEERIARLVRYPTQDLVLVPATDPTDLPDAIVADPRSVLLDLVTGRLLARRFVQEEPVPRTRVAMTSEVRVYVLDGSTSMAGPRGRVRDAILVAELATLMARLASPGFVRATLYFRYFDETLDPVTRVDTVEGARAAIADVLSTPRFGGTNIQRALVASLEQIRIARDLDPKLARAQIVLVTDGEASVDEAALVTARAGLFELPVGISVIALGQENPALRAIVARQRATGEAAFYHYLDDGQLEAIATARFDDGLALHLPDAPSRPLARVARDLSIEVGPLVDELVAIERERDVATMEGLDAELQALREGGAPDAADQGVRARLEAKNRDRVALGARFARWFPAAGVAETDTAPAVPRHAGEDVEAVACALASVAEVTSLLGGSELARQADAIDLLERLLPDAQLTPARYRAALRDHPDLLGPALAAVHRAVRGRPGA